MSDARGCSRVGRCSGQPFRGTHRSHSQGGPLCSWHCTASSGDARFLRGPVTPVMCPRENDWGYEQGSYSAPAAASRPAWFPGGGGVGVSSQELSRDLLWAFFWCRDLEPVGLSEAGLTSP